MTLWIGLIIIILGYLYTPRRKHIGLPLPPGPRGLPLVGNVLDFPTSDFARNFHELGVRFGGLVYLNVLGRSIILLDSREAAYELLEKRARNYSDRPDSVMARLTSIAYHSMAAMPYGQAWRQQRRIFHQSLQLNAVNSQYLPKIGRVVHGMLLNLADDPKTFSRHLHHAFAASILSVGYGIEITRKDHYYVDILHTALKILEAVVVPGRYLVEALPALQHLPRWFPGMGFRKEGEYVRQEIERTRLLLYEKGKSLLDSECSGDSMLSSTFRRIATTDTAAAAEEEDRLSGALLATFIAGSDTTVASLHAFFLAMAMYPDVQERAQAELDHVIGREHLPDFKDRDNLPYLNAVVKELSRWNVVAPIALLHASLEDDEYNGYHIPGGSLLVPNLWAYSRDPALYPDPETFNPDRFLKDGKLDPGARDPYSYIFGLGRRICPGRHLADSSLFLACASILHVFRISPPLDDHGQPVELEARMDTDNVISHPKEFECIVEPRWADAADLLRT